MSEHGVHAHAAHEHETSHQTRNKTNLSQYVAIFTAVISAYAAVIGYHGSIIQSEAIRLKNDAVIKQNQEVNQWNYYQANSNKLHLAELAIELIPNKSAFYSQQIAKYSQLKEQSQKQALLLDAQFLQTDQESSRLMANRHKESLAIMFLEIAIALASITALTRKRWLFAFAGIASIIGVILSIVSWVSI